MQHLEKLEVNLTPESIYMTEKYGLMKHTFYNFITIININIIITLLIILILLLLLLLLLFLLLLSFVLSSIVFVNVRIVLYPLNFFMAQVKDQQSHSLHLILAYLIFVSIIFRLIVFKFYDFVILL